MTAGAPIRVLVVDDSVVIRKLVSEILDAHPRIEVVGTAQNGQVALAKLVELRPDAITLDIEMPVMDGITCLRELRKSQPRLPVVMFSTLTERGAAATLDALAAGASDYVMKPANVGSIRESRENISEQLIPKLIALTQARRLVAGTLPTPTPAGPGGARNAAGRARSRAAGTPVVAGPNFVPAAAAASGAGPAPAVAPASVVLRPAGSSVAATSMSGQRKAAFAVLAIGCSTGGPDALVQLLSAFPADLPVPVLIVQHMPALFTRMLAQRLDSTCPLSISEAADGDAVERGRVLIAPGGRHLEIRTKGTGVVTHLSDEPPENYCRPAVDVLFRSVAQVYRNRTLGVVLTGMGRDGAQGATMIRNAGGEMFAQDEASSVVWGMPGAVVQAGQADRVISLDQLAAQIIGAVLKNQPAQNGRSAGVALPSGVGA